MPGLVKEMVGFSELADVPFVKLHPVEGVMTQLQVATAL
jgi:hypothetical protein